MILKKKKKLYIYIYIKGKKYNNIINNIIYSMSSLINDNMITITKMIILVNNLFFF